MRATPAVSIGHPVLHRFDAGMMVEICHDVPDPHRTGRIAIGGDEWREQFAGPRGAAPAVQTDA